MTTLFSIEKTISNLQNQIMSLANVVSNITEHTESISTLNSISIDDMTVTEADILFQIYCIQLGIDPSDFSEE